MPKINKIAVIGNACGGKTRLSHRLAALYQMPLIHVDSLQFEENLKLRPYPQTIELLKVEQAKERWIIDGFGPLDILQDRLKLADAIIMIDLPIWKHYLWAAKRTFENIFRGQRGELPPKSSERNFEHIVKLFKTIHQIHTKMRPEMLRILNRQQFAAKTRLVTSVKEWSSIYKNGLVWDGDSYGNSISHNQSVQPKNN